MGKIPKSGFALDNVRVKVKRPSAAIAGNCGPECISYLACLEKTSGDEVACKSARDALVKCMAAAANTRVGSQHKPAINFHLQKVRLLPKLREHVAAIRTRLWFTVSPPVCLMAVLNAQALLPCAHSSSKGSRDEAARSDTTGRVLEERRACAGGLRRRGLGAALRLLSARVPAVRPPRHPIRCEASVLRRSMS